MFDPEFVTKAQKLVSIVCLVYLFNALPAGYAMEPNGPSLTVTPAPPYPELEPGSGLMVRYERELLKHQSVLIDSFGPPSYLEWTRRFNRERYSIHDHIASSGASATARFLGDSLRETAVSRLPLDQWKGFGELVLGSLGNTAEERSETVST